MLKTGDRKIFDYCGACTFYLGAIVVTLICQAFAGVVSAMLAGVDPDISSSGDFVTAFMIVIQAANALFIVLYCKVNKSGFGCSLAYRQDKKIDYRDFLIPVGCAILLFVAMYLPTVWYGYFTAYALHIPPNVGAVDLNTPSSVVMIVIASVFMAPIFEESIYRGVLFNGLKNRYSAIKAILLSALAFMLMHMSPIQVVFQFALGVLSAAIMAKTHRLLPCVIAHATANAVALTVQSPPMIYVMEGCLEWLTASPVAAAFITLGLLFAGGASIFALIGPGYGKPCVQPVAQPTKDTPATPDAVREGALAEARNKDGTVRYVIAAALSGVLFIINMVTMMEW